MPYTGQSLRLEALPGEDGLVELCFDRQGEAINKLDERTVAEFREATAWLAAEAAAGRLRGVLLSSAKEVFIVGADITEFGALFAQPPGEIAAGVRAKNEIFCAFEDLPVPSVVALNGFALGGGLELALAASHRVMSQAAQVGVPEVKLGLFPGFGGTVRLCRVAGPETAIAWVAGGQPAKAEAALQAGVVDAVARPEALRETALQWLRDAASGGATGKVAGPLDWQAAQQRKRVAVPLTASGVQELFDAALRRLDAQPAARAAVAMMARAALLPRAEALTLEAQAFAAITQTQAAHGLVQVFLNEQAVKKRGRALAKAGAPARELAVLGAGTMGGGIAYAAALRGTPVVLKDIAPAALDAGLGEAARLLDRQVRAGRLGQDKADAVLARIQARSDDQGMDRVDLLIEAIVERLEVKRSVLGALEDSLPADAVIASNTSSLRIADIGRDLRHPERLVGMHFFNPVPAMPLVEVVRGPRSSDAAVARAVAQAQAMGKTPIVVRDVPGFLVNRLVTPYVNAFLQLLADGADFQAVDRAMEAFGWPMGPAWLQDVVGMDVGLHVGEVIAAGYPGRMPAPQRHAVRAMVQAGRHGQKNGRGFYAWAPDATGKLQRTPDPDAQALVAGLQAGGPRHFDDAEIVDRLMLPLLLEAALALDEGVVDSAAELDMALLLGLGFPAHTGGALKYADWLGLPELLARCERHAALGPAYQPGAALRRLAADGGRFYPRFDLETSA